jgi:hypothetical protein
MERAVVVLENSGTWVEREVHHGEPFIGGRPILVQEFLSGAE